MTSTSNVQRDLINGEEFDPFDDNPTRKLTNNKGLGDSAPWYKNDGWKIHQAPVRKDNVNIIFLKFIILYKFLIINFFEGIWRQ